MTVGMVDWSADRTPGRSRFLGRPASEMALWMLGPGPSGRGRAGLRRVRGHEGGGARGWM